MVANIPGTLDSYTAQNLQGIVAGYPGAWQGPYAGATSLTLDPTTAYGTSTFRLNTSAAAAFTLTIAATANPTYLFDGQRLQILINTGAWAVTVAFATSVVFQRNTNPAIQPSGLTSIEVQWDAALSIWHETSRNFTPDTSATPLAGGWQNLSLPSGWTTNGAYQSAQYKLDERTGFVEFRGLMFSPASTTAATTTLVTMPSGFRPTASNDVIRAITYNGTTDVLLTLNIGSSGVISNRQALTASTFIAFTGDSRYSID